MLVCDIVPALRLIFLLNPYHLVALRNCDRVMLFVGKQSRLWEDSQIEGAIFLIQLGLSLTKAVLMSCHFNFLTSAKAQMRWLLSLIGFYSNQNYIPLSNWLHRYFPQLCLDVSAIITPNPDVGIHSGIIRSIKGCYWVSAISRYQATFSNKAGGWSLYGYLLSFRLNNSPSSFRPLFITFVCLARCYIPEGS